MPEDFAANSSSRSADFSFVMDVCIAIWWLEKSSFASLAPIGGLCCGDTFLRPLERKRVIVQQVLKILGQAVCNNFETRVFVLG